LEDFEELEELEDAASNQQNLMEDVEGEDEGYQSGYSEEEEEDVEEPFEVRKEREIAALRQFALEGRLSLKAEPLVEHQRRRRPAVVAGA